MLTSRYDNVVRNCVLSRSPWEDPNFEASNRVLVSSNQPTSIFTYGGRGISGSSLQWLRPHDICRQLQLGKDPVFFGREVNRFDINQGEIGNCWFLAALANLAENKAIFDLVVPPNQEFTQGYAGAFRFRFWRFGEWTEVVIDDRLPTRSGELIYIRSREKNEFWSALLEKAYAKLHGSYRALEGGLTIEAAVDFTGGIPELIDLTTTTMSQLEIFHLMKKSYDRGAFLGCALGVRLFTIKYHNNNMM